MPRTDDWKALHKLPGWTDNCDFAFLLVLKMAVCLQAKCGALQLDDKSRFTVLPPRIWGLIPRLASQLHIEQVRAIISHKAKQGLMLSVELLDCAAAGFQGEPGNFICRSAFTSLGFKTTWSSVSILLESRSGLKEHAERGPGSLY